MQDVVRVAIEGGGPGVWDVLGNGAVTTVLAAAVAYGVSRLSRGREDRAAWRELRHEKYSEVLQHVEIVKIRSINIVSTQLSPHLTGSEWDRLSREYQDAVDAIRDDCADTRLMGHGKVSESLDMYRYLAHDLQSVMNLSGPRSHEDPKNHVQQMMRESERLEFAMREQLGISSSRRARKEAARRRKIEQNRQSQP